MEISLQYPDSLINCSICPRNCKANRLSSPLGYCGTDASFSISSIFRHRGEEPVISGPKGICNVFFTGCNLKCIYCQNFQISRPTSPKSKMTLNDVISQIEKILDQGVRAVGFVSTSHVVPQVIEIIRTLRSNGLNPTFVYNTNAYERPEVIKQLEGFIDVYLPDFKYISPELAKLYSDAENYPYFAKLVLKEIYRQKGSTLHTNDEGQAECGILIRHLVLPGHADESNNVLQFIANEVSTGVHLALMSQYYPCDKALLHPKLGRELKSIEYQKVVEKMLQLGFRNAYIQSMDSFMNYRPDFENFEPFE